MSFERISEMTPIAIWDGIRARAFEGERMTFAVVDLDPDAVVAEHRHHNEQLGLVLRGEIVFTIAGETRTLRRGEGYVIPSDIPHDARAGRDGCTVVDVFAPGRADWATLERLAVTPPAWPSD
ncbi:MAG: cupin domain-containing protein [Candidatus Dormibacteria bacterium]